MAVVLTVRRMEQHDCQRGGGECEGGVTCEQQGTARDDRIGERMQRRWLVPSGETCRSLDRSVASRLTVLQVEPACDAQQLLRSLLHSMLPAQQISHTVAIAPLNGGH